MFYTGAGVIVAPGGQGHEGGSHGQGHQLKRNDLPGTEHLVLFACLYMN